MKKIKVKDLENAKKVSHETFKEALGAEEIVKGERIMIKTRFKKGEKVYSFATWGDSTKGEFIEGIIGHIFYLDEEITITIDRGEGHNYSHIPQKYVRKTKAGRHKCLVNFLEKKLEKKNKQCKELKESIKILKRY